MSWSDLGSFFWVSKAALPGWGFGVFHGCDLELFSAALVLKQDPENWRRLDAYGIYPCS